MTCVTQIDLGTQYSMTATAADESSFNARENEIQVDAEVCRKEVT